MKLVQVTTNQQLQYFQAALIGMIQTLIDKTHGKATVERVMGLIIGNLSSPYFRLYIVIDDKFVPVAYYIIQIGIDDDSGELMAYVYQHVSTVGLIPEINKQLESLLVIQGAKTAKFITKRNADAFEKSLGDTWEQTGIVFEKELKGE